MGPTPLLSVKNNSKSVLWETSAVFLNLSTAKTNQFFFVTLPYKPCPI